MLDFVKKLYEDLLVRLDGESHSIVSSGLSPDHRLERIRDAIDQIRERLKGYHFAGEAEEINFFKTLLPQFFSLSIYYSEQFNQESMEFVGTLENIKEYSRRLSRKIEDFYRENGEFIRYCRSGSTSLDQQYFVRSRSVNQLSADLMLSVIDSSFCTPYSLKLGIMMGYAWLESDAKQRAIDQKQQSGIGASKKIKLEWTDKTRGLVELIYAFQEQGSFNGGTADIKTITSYFEMVFSVSLGNIYRTYQDILSRQKDYTDYLDKLRAKLLRRIDVVEQKHIR